MASQPETRIINGLLVHEDYEILAGEVGKGKIGRVYKATDKDNVIRAAKQLTAIDSSAYSNLDEFKQPFLIQHDNLARTIDLCRDRYDMWLVTEFYDKGDLNTYFNSVRTLDEKAKAICQLSNGLQHLHSKEIPHMLLHPKNIFITLDEHGQVVLKLSDYGYSKYLQFTSSMYGNNLADKFLAPEVISKMAKTCQEYKMCDVFSFALIALGILQSQGNGQPIEPKIEGAFTDNEMQLPIGQVLYCRFNYKNEDCPVVHILNTDCNFTKRAKLVIRNAAKYRPCDRINVKDMKDQFHRCANGENPDIPSTLLESVSMGQPINVETVTCIQNNQPIINYTVIMDQELGRGSFGKVYNAVDQNGTKVAAKSIQIRAVASGEFKALRQIPHHDNIVRYLHSDREELNDISWLFLELCLFDLNNFAISLPERFHDERTKYRIMLDIARGVDHCHKNGVLHRDVKPSNILISKHPRKNDHFIAKIGDMGLSKVLCPDERFTDNRSKVGTGAFKCPELWLAASRPEYNDRADVFAIGATYLSMLKAPNNDGYLVPSIEDDTQLRQAEKQQAIGQIILYRQQNGEVPVNVVTTQPNDSPFIKLIKDIITSATKFDPNHRPQPEGIKYRLRGFEFN